MDATVFPFSPLTVAPPPPPHPSSEAVAAYVDGRLTRDERADLERHLAECDACRREVVEVSELLTGARTRRPGAAAAVAASVLLAACLAGVLLLVSAPDRPGGPAAPVLREGGAEVDGLVQIAVLAPPEGAVVPTRRVAFVWRATGADAFYRVTVTDRNGDVAWKGETADTSLQVRDGAGLRAGAPYFWYVDALLPDGSSITSGIRTFRTAP